MDFIIQKGLAQLRGIPNTQNPTWPWHYLPNGIFTTEKFERANRKNLEDHGLFNDFTELYKHRGKELYTIAMNLDCAQQAVFGHDEINTVPISKAMEASFAIPFFYKPVNIDGVDYAWHFVVSKKSRFQERHYSGGTQRI